MAACSRRNISDSRWNVVFGGWVDASITCLDFDGTRSYVGGHLEGMFDPTIHLSIAVFENKSGPTGVLGNGVDGTVYTIAHNGNDVYIGGSFAKADNSISVRNIAHWDGASWHPMGKGVDQCPRKLITMENYVYASGLFTRSDSILLHGIGLWNGRQWLPLGSGLTGGSAYTMALIDKNLYVGGDFQTAGGRKSHYLACWTHAFIDSGRFTDSVRIDTTKGIYQPLTFSVSQSYPNPSLSTSMISYTLPEQSLVGIKLYDLLGREVRAFAEMNQSAGSHTFSLDVHDLPSAMYMLNLRAGTHSASIKINLLK